MVHVVLPRQSLGDVAIQLYGSVEGIARLAELNGIGATAGLVPGQVLVHDAVGGTIPQYYARQHIAVASWEALVIGPMIIGTTFLID